MSRRRRGHFCWCCGRMRPNERFSGRNHGRHLCRDCARLPAEERDAEERRRIYAEERALEEAAAASYPNPDESTELDGAKREYHDDDPF